MGGRAIVSVERVSLRYHTPLGETLALEDVSFEVEEGEFLALVGPSGCGKSTLLSLISGLLTPSSGQIFVSGNPVGPHSLGQVGYMLQHDHLFPWCDVWHNVLLGLSLRKEATPEKEAWLQGLLRQYGLGDFIHRFPRHLSGGMRQRVALLRTLAISPQILLLDEPFSALDYQSRITVSDDIARIIRGEGKTAILVTHDISEAISMADRVLVLSERPGRLKCEIPLKLTSESSHVIDKRHAPEFGAYFNRIWKELNIDGQ